MAPKRTYSPEQRERQREKARAFRKAHPERSRWYTIKYRYGITREQYEALLEQQGHACAICKTPDEGLWWGFFVVDHDHDTGVVRGLLCSPCNGLLGGARDRIDVLRSAITYLEGGGA